MLRNMRKQDRRKTLQSLQPSASDLNLLVPSPSMANKGGKEVKIIHNASPIPKPDEKENVASVRRSKRKNTDLNEQFKMTPSKEDNVPAKTQKSKSSKSLCLFTKSSKSKTAIAKMTEEKVTVVNDASKSNKRPEEPSTSADNTADETVNIFEEGSEKVDLLTSETPALSYWIDIAEQRRLALEEALYENAQIADQLEVLQTENMQLKSTLLEAEKVLKIVNASL